MLSIVGLSLIPHLICSLLLGGSTLPQPWNDCVHGFTSKAPEQTFCVCTSLCKKCAVFLLRPSVPRPCSNKVPTTSAPHKMFSIKDSKTRGSMLQCNCASDRCTEGSRPGQMYPRCWHWCRGDRQLADSVLFDSLCPEPTLPASCCQL